MSLASEDRIADDRGAQTATPVRYVYLCSAMHSGSTLLSCLLDAHPEVASVGELGSHVARTGTCSCGASYGECPFWIRLEERAREIGLDYEIGKPGIDLQPRNDSSAWESLFYHQFPHPIVNRLRDLLYRPGSRLRKAAAIAAEKSAALARLVCELRDASTFLDTTKNPFQPRFLVNHPEIDLKVIALVRDGRAVMNSIRKRYGYSREDAVASWIWANRNIERVIGHEIPAEAVFRIRHEDLCRSPRETMSRLFDFLEVADVELPSTEVGDRHIIGNVMRRRFSGEIAIDEAWRQDLSDDDLAYFESQAGAMNRRYGYPPNDQVR